MINDKKCENVIDKLDIYAVDKDQYEYGLPNINKDDIEQMKQIIRENLK